MKGESIKIQRMVNRTRRGLRLWRARKGETGRLIRALYWTTKPRGGFIQLYVKQPCEMAVHGTQVRFNVDEAVEYQEVWLGQRSLYADVRGCVGLELSIIVYKEERRSYGSSLDHGSAHVVGDAAGAVDC